MRQQLEQLQKWFGESHTAGPREEEIKRQYQRIPSFSDQLSFVDFDDETELFLLEDGISTGAVLQLRDFPSETLTPEELSKKHEELVRLLYEIMPLEEDNPWVGQFFVSNDYSLHALSKSLRDYVVPELKEDPLTQKYLSLCDELFEEMTREEGILNDPLKGDLPFRAGYRNIYFVLYRHYSTKAKGLTLEKSVKEILEVIDMLQGRLRADGFFVRQLGGAQIYEWLVKWFNPSPKLFDGSTVKLLEAFPYPEKKPFGWSFTQNTLFGSIESDMEGFIFDGQKSKLLVIEKMNTSPEIGCISREKERNKMVVSFLDKLPEGSTYTLQIVFESQKKVKSHLAEIEKSAIGTGEAPKRAIKNVEAAFNAIDENNGLFRVTQGIFLTAKDDESLEKEEKALALALADEKIQLIPNAYSIAPVDNYLRLLPFNFRYDYDVTYSYLSQYLFASDIAALLPLYGRSRIDKKIEPLNVFFNRGGEPVVFDQYTRFYKQGIGGSHEFIFGSTGAGKSVEVNHKILRNLAIKNARVVVIEAGNSCGLTAQFVKEQGRTVRQIVFDRLNPVPMNPYVEAYAALQQIEKEEAFFAENVQDKALAHDAFLQKKSEMFTREIALDETELSSENEDRDVLAEMVLATRTMITCGDEKEESRLIQSDNVLIMDVLIEAIKQCRQDEKPQVLVTDVVEAFERFANTAQTEHDRARLTEMGRNLNGFIKNPVRASFVNRPSAPLEDCDLLHIELGFLQENNPVSQSMLTLIAISILSKVLAMAEAHQHSSRPTILMIDEIHVLTKHPVFCAALVLASKVARKYGFWLVLSTQNLDDFLTPDAKKILTMLETWLVLQTSKKERNKLNEYYELSAEDNALIEKIHSPKGVYSELVLLNKNNRLLMRHIPPRLLLALSMTEQDEKEQRMSLMKKHGISEIEACELIAKNMQSYKPVYDENEGFGLC